ncbi:MAG: GAF domain-containing protein, partial [Pseudothermotoga sp.]
LKQIENEKKILSESENKYRELSEQFKRYFDLVQVMIVGLDKDGNVILANKKTCETLGYEYDEIKSKNWFKHFVINEIREDLYKHFENLKERSNGVVDYYENTIRLKNGSERIIAWCSTFFEDRITKTETVLAAGLDITQLRQTEDKLSKQLKLSKDLYWIAEQIVLEEPDIQKRSYTLSRMCVELLGASLAWVGYAAPDKSVRILGFYPDDGHEYMKDLIVRWDDGVYGEGVVGRSIKTASYQVIEDVLNDERFNVWRDKIAPYGLKSILSFPLISPKGVFGALVMYSNEYGFFNQEKIEQIRILSHLAAATLENAGLFEELQKEFSRIEALHQIDKTIGSSTDLKVILAVVLDQVIHQLGVHAADVLLYDEHSMTLEYADGRGFKTKIVDPKPIKLGKTLPGKVGLDKKPIMISVDSLEASEKFSNPYFEEFKSFVHREGFVFYAAVPLIAKGNLLGVLETFNRSHIEDEEFLESLQMFGQQTAIAIDNARLFEDLQRRNVELIDAYDATIEGWAYALDLRDKET